jgi:phosphopantothenoylcysteine decarboxylase/phosphopantothenate--cysteine ligase
LGQNADCVVVAPATARVIGAYAAGISSDLLTATLIATRSPVVVCPAMHTEMWEHPAVVDNIATLVERGVHIAAPVGRGEVGFAQILHQHETALVVRGVNRRRLQAVGAESARETHEARVILCRRR